MRTHRHLLSLTDLCVLGGYPQIDKDILSNLHRYIIGNHCYTIWRRLNDDVKGTKNRWKCKKRQKTNLHICVNAQGKISYFELFYGFPDLFMPWTNIIDPKHFDLSHSCCMTTGYWGGLLFWWARAERLIPNLKLILILILIPNPKQMGKEQIRICSKWQYDVIITMSMISYCKLLSICHLIN